jgi:hypothetical protein
MSQQIINIGSAPNDGSGDQLRVSFDKCNLNFTELYDGLTASLPIGNAIQYQFSNSTSEPPGAQEIRLNNATQSAATLLWASHTTSSGINIKQFLSAATTGAKLILQDKNDNTNYIKFDVTSSPVDKSTYWEFPVSVTVSGGNLPNAAILASVTAATAGGGGNVSNVGTPTNGQLAQWTDATHIQGIAVSSLGLASLASPIFTGDPQAPTPTTADNDTSIATTAFVKAQGYATIASLASYAPLASPALTGSPTAPTAAVGTSTTQIATTAFVDAESVAKAGDTMTGALTLPADPTTGLQAATKQYVDARVGSPQGRLTLQSGVPVMTTSTSGAGGIYYTPYVANLVPLYDGTRFVMTTFSQLFCATTDTSQNPSAIGANKVNDWFVWSDAGILKLTHGPDWTNDTTRSAGTALVVVGGLWLNNAAITNGPAAQRGTYIGTTRSNASSLLDWIFGGVSAGGTAGFFGVWNVYNRVLVNTFVGDSTASWTYAITDFRNVNASAGNRVSYVAGLAEDGVRAEYSVTFNGGNGAVGIGLNSSTVPTGIRGYASSATLVAPIVGAYANQTALGFQFLQAIEWAAASTVFLGQGTTAGDVYLQSGLIFQFRM